MPPLLIPKVIAHRGAKAYAPENTLAAFHAAADLGIEWVQADVKITKDGVAILFHDEELSRCTNGSGLVAETDWQTIQELDAGSWFGESFIGEKIPSLEDALNMFLERGLGVNLEIKPCPGREVETAEVMLDIATRVWPDDQAPPLVSSFQHVSLETAFEMMPDWHRGLLTDEPIDNWKEIMEYLQAATMHVNADKITQEMVDEYIELQKPILAYVVDSPDQARELIRWGVDGFISDAPDALRDELDSRH